LSVALFFLFALSCRCGPLFCSPIPPSRPNVDKPGIRASPCTASSAAGTGRRILAWRPRLLVEFVPADARARRCSLRGEVCWRRRKRAPTMSFNTICLWLQVYVVDAATRLFWNPNTITMIRSSPARAIQRTANARRRVTVPRQRCGCGKSGSSLANNETGQRQVSQTNSQRSQHGLGPQEFSSLPIDPPGLATGRRSPAGKACISKEPMHEQRGASRGKILAYSIVRVPSLHLCESIETFRDVAV